MSGFEARGGGVSQCPAPTKGDGGTSHEVGRSEATAGRADNGSGARSAANPLAPVIGFEARGGGVSQGPSMALGQVASDAIVYVPIRVAVASTCGAIAARTARPSTTPSTGQVAPSSA